MPGGSNANRSSGHGGNYGSGGGSKGSESSSGSSSDKEITMAKGKGNYKAKSPSSQKWMDAHRTTVKKNK